MSKISCVASWSGRTPLFKPMRMANVKGPAHLKSTGDEPVITIILYSRADAAPSLDEARLVFSWIEAELLDLFKDTS